MSTESENIKIVEEGFKQDRFYRVCIGSLKHCATLIRNEETQILEPNNYMYLTEIRKDRFIGYSWTKHKLNSERIVHFNREDWHVEYVYRKDYIDSTELAIMALK